MTATPTNRPLGIFFTIAAALGILFCLLGLFLTWRIRAGFVHAAEDNLVLLKETLGTTGEGLEVVDQVLQTTGADLARVRTSIYTLTLAISDTTAILASVATLTGTDLPATVRTAQTSLASAQASALLIDNTIAALASLPLLGLDAYQPEVPLNVALGEVSASLDPLVPSLEDISTSLDGAAANLAELETQLGATAEAGEEIDRALQDAQTVIAEYHGLLADFETQVEAAREAAPGWSAAVAWLLTALFVGLGVSMLGLGERGLELARVGGSDEVRREEAKPIPSLAEARGIFKGIDTEGLREETDEER